MIFKWLKQHGCDCHPIDEGCERYFLSIGGIYEASVESKRCAHSDGHYWEWSLTVANANTCGGSGGGKGRDASMADAEDRISQYLAELQLVSSTDKHKREIYDALVETNSDTGEWFHRRLA